MAIIHGSSHATSVRGRACIQSSVRPVEAGKRRKGRGCGGRIVRGVAGRQVTRWVGLAVVLAHAPVFAAGIPSGSLEEVVVTAQRAGLVGTSGAASEGIVT